MSIGDHMEEEAFMKKISREDLKPFELAPGITANVITSDTMTIMHARLKAGASAPEHSHVQEQIVNVIEGEIELTVEGKPHHLKLGDTLILPPNVLPLAKAITDCHVLDVFCPVREDLASGNFSGYPEKN